MFEKFRQQDIIPQNRSKGSKLIGKSQVRGISGGEKKQNSADQSYKWGQRDSIREQQTKKSKKQSDQMVFQNAKMDV